VLTVVNDFAGIFGGSIVSKAYVGIPYSLYWRTVLQQMISDGFTMRVLPNDLIQGVVKPFVFGGIIAFTGCHYGLKTTGGTEGVGTATTRTVVTASILILIVDYFLTQILLTVLHA
jgi:phospholipid/cholesterol/gamma-HCH transport system permease protein